MLTMLHEHLKVSKTMTYYIYKTLSNTYI